MFNADVIIAGAGPAGSTAALTLARQGVDVLLLDKAIFPRPKLCGGLLTWKSMRLLERLHGCRPCDLVQSGIVDTISDGFALFHKGRPVAEGRCAYPFHLVTRSKLDSYLLDAARRAGVRVRENCSVLTCLTDGTLSTPDGPLRAPYVIGADGANSVVRRSFGLPRLDWHRYLAASIEISVPRAMAPRITERPELHAGILSAGYGWVFPNRDAMILGICGLARHTDNFRHTFARFLHTLGVHDPEQFMTAHPLHGHPLPYGNALRQPAQGARLLAGDAAGFVEPLLGEGIFYALLTGWYAGEAVGLALRTGEEPGPAYTRRLQRFVWPEFSGANRLRWLLHGLERIGDRRALGGCFHLRTRALAETVHGRRSYAWGRRKRWDF